MFVYQKPCIHSDAGGNRNKPRSFFTFITINEEMLLFNIFILNQITKWFEFSVGCAIY